MTEIRIDTAVHADLPVLVDLLGELFTLERDFEPDAARQSRALRLIMDNPTHGRIFVIRDGDQVVGMTNAIVTISTAEGGPVVELQDVIVRASHRGRGLGGLLLSSVFAWAAQQGMQRITLLADEHNHPALGFYRHLGFRSISQVPLRLFYRPARQTEDGPG